MSEYTVDFNNLECLKNPAICDGQEVDDYGQLLCPLLNWVSGNMQHTNGIVTLDSLGVFHLTRFIDLVEISNIVSSKVYPIYSSGWSLVIGRLNKNDADEDGRGNLSMDTPKIGVVGLLANDGLLVCTKDNGEEIKHTDLSIPSVILHNKPQFE